jgi:hypothetical protein
LKFKIHINCIFAAFLCHDIQHDGVFGFLNPTFHDLHFIFGVLCFVLSSQKRGFDPAVLPLVKQLRILKQYVRSIFLPQYQNCSCFAHQFIG